MSGTNMTPERLTKRLSRVFNEIFPSLDVADAPDATMDNVAGWDSMATIMLCAQCEEDFGVKIGFDRIAETKSFADLYKLIEGLTR